MNFRLTEWVWKRSPITIPNDRILLLAIAAEADQDGFSRVGLVTLAERVREGPRAVRRGLARLVKAEAIWIPRFDEISEGRLGHAAFEMTIGIQTKGAKCGPRIPKDGEAAPRPPRQTAHPTLAPPPRNAPASPRPIPESHSRILRALAERSQGMTRKNLAIGARLNEDSGFYERSLRELRDKGWIATSGSTDEIKRITDLGRAALGHDQANATPDATLKYWIGALENGPSRMLATLAAFHPDGLTASQLGTKLQRIPDSPGFVTDLALLRKKALVNRVALDWKANDILFD